MFDVFIDGFKPVCNINVLREYLLKESYKDKVEIHGRDSGIFIVGFGRKLSL